MARSSPFQKLTVVANCATLAAQAIRTGEGFRQRDLKFLLELFSNWLQYSISEESIQIANMQVARYLRNICQEGYCREIRKRSATPSYALTRAGMVELLRQIVSHPVHKRPVLLFFVEYFIGSYRQIIMQMIENEGVQFPPALRLEAESLLNLANYRTKQREQIRLELDKLELRIRDSKAMAAETTKLKRSCATYDVVVKAIEDRYPYELNSQKPLGELMRNIPEAQGIWELSAGGEARATKLWQPLRQLWLAYLAACPNVE